MEFKGYRRADGRVGTRNFVGILSTVVCANEASERIADGVQGTAAFLHQQGCGQTPVDVARVSQTLVNLGKNPNLASVLLVSLGCESVVLEEVAQGIAAAGKRVEQLVIQEEGGAARSVARGQLLAQQLVMEASTLPATLCPISELRLGLKCGEIGRASCRERV
jgi:altronate dehydratase large subunit